MATIGLLTVPMPGHARPALRACSRLAAAGHQVRIIKLPETSISSSRSLEATEYKPMQAIAVGTAERAEAYVEQVAEALLADSVDIVFHDAQAPWGRIAAEWLGLPRLCSFPLFPHQLAPDSASSRAQTPVDPELVTRLSAVRETVVKRWAVEIGGFGDVVSNAGDATIAYTTSEILGGRPPEDHWNLVGPLLPGPEAQPRPRREGAPRVYAALGTVHNRRPEPFQAIAQALGSEARLLVSTGGGLAPERLGTLPESVEVVPWVDPQKALEGADVHITHGGGSSVHEALVAGVPMICIPQGSDQHHWARRVEAVGAGIVLEDLSARPLRAALKRILEDEAFSAHAAELAAHLRSYDGDSRLLAAVETLVP